MAILSQPSLSNLNELAGLADFGHPLRCKRTEYLPPLSRKVTVANGPDCMPALLRPFCPLFLTCLVLAAAACSSTPDEQQMITSTGAETRDLSGHWEKDYQRSDDFSNRFNLYVADIRRLQLQDQRGDLGGARLRTSNINAEAINGLARFAEELTRMPGLVIAQNEGSIDIDREEDFSLDCDWGDQRYSQNIHAFGADYCGWDRQRLVFRMDITGGLQIIHQFSLSPDASMLNVTTTVSSDQAALPMTISNFYQRYDAPEEGFDCTLTLTRSRVCQQTGSRP